MQTYASIDVGTNSVRLLIAEKQGSKIRTLYKDMETTRIGEGLGSSTQLKTQAIRRTVEAIVHFYKLAKDKNVQEIYIFATSAVRDAENKQEFIDAVRGRLGLSPEIISGEEEATLSYLGAAADLSDAAKEDLLVIDIGGGSTEIIYKDKEIQGFSVPVGAVRLSEIPYSREDIAAFFKKIISEIPLDKPYLVGVGGTATSLAAIAQKLDPYDSNRVHNYRLRTQDVREIAEKLHSLSVEARKEIPGLHPSRADIIPCGTDILLTLLEMLKADEILISEHDLLQGRIIKGS